MSWELRQALSLFFFVVCGAITGIYLIGDWGQPVGWNMVIACINAVASMGNFTNFLRGLDEEVG